MWLVCIQDPVIYILLLADRAMETPLAKLLAKWTYSAHTVQLQPASPLPVPAPGILYAEAAISPGILDR